MDILNFRGRQGLEDSESPAVILSNTSNVNIQNYVADPSTKMVVKVSGSESSDIKIQGIQELSDVQKALSVDTDVINKASIQYIR